MKLSSLQYIQSKFITFFTILFTFSISCNSSDKKVTTYNSNKPKSQKIFIIESPVMDEVHQINEPIHFILNKRKNTVTVDSTVIYVDGKLIRSEVESPLNFSSLSDFKKVGRQNLRIRIFYNDSLTQTISTRITLLSDRTPAELKFKVVRSIPHSTESYTQGLFYHKGFLYEGTGKEEKSKILKIDPENGDVLLQRKLEPDIFGEGITLYNNQIFQLTYTKKVGFVYDLETFERIREFDLQTAQGWGLTTDDHHLIVSEGSSMLYFYDPEYFSQTNQLDVCSDKSLVTSLNELEYINGEIWANVYGRHYIVRIDAETGKVTGTLNLSTLFPKDIPEDYEHVLNGIAYNSDNQTLFITGKFWPVIYEIEVFE